MKAASSDLIAYLNTRPTNLIIADCFTFFLANGGVYRYTSAEVPVVYDGNTFLANSVLVLGLKFSSKRGVDVDEQDITIAAGPNDIMEGVPFLQALAAGVLDGAHIQRDMAFLPAWNQPAIGNSDPVFYGRVSTLTDLGRNQATVKVKSETVVLDRDFPRNLWQATCLHTLYDSGCTLSKSANGVSATVAAGSTTTVINLSGPGDAVTFGQGTITFTSGVLDGVSATVKSGSDSPLSVTLAAPLTIAPATGTTCIAYKGCDHTTGAQGCAKFSNLAHFRGFPYVPPPSAGL